MSSDCCSAGGKVSIERILRFLKLVSDENRLKIICLLTRGEKCVCEIWQNLGISQNLASHHLKVLKRFGLLSSKKAGLKVIYRLNDSILQEYQHLLSHYLTSKPIKK